MKTQMETFVASATLHSPTKLQSYAHIQFKATNIEANSADYLLPALKHTPESYYITYHG